ncbi:DNA-3-methyladenine glycosylase I [Colwellia sp. 4_MG-2023]|uniref:DNA-3-methyladenine glycosylase I n=1 Tax=unclassified Colwellia TaxID=196834 RepID=UPI0026E41024|nr:MULTISPECIES: DNA-3-methyladenine glycosylase I [unclassified Colwellia]MDO6505845.1 DNA-3-methyladenine glycosylase I [Colwellia sp. 5_MG-2023]MDO6554526.1 DNA-3-methyladenine glycosylase I [Colwellia sp. 4_MG-2023]
MTIDTHINTTEKFSHLYQRAAERKGGTHALEVLLGQKIVGKKLLPDSAAQENVSNLTDDRILSAFTKQIFKSGFVWRVVENKWPDFEDSFFNFNIEKVLMMPEEMLEKKAADPKIIRNYNKVKTIQANAQMIFEHQTEHNTSFAQFIAEWPTTDIIGLWTFLKKHGKRLGGNTGPYALRLLGKDTFILSSDVEAYLRAQKVIDGGLQSKKSLTAIQTYFNQLQQESGYSLTQLSRLIALASGDNYVHVVQA